MSRVTPRALARPVRARALAALCALALLGGSVPRARAAPPLTLAVLELRDSSEARPAAAAYLSDLVRDRASRDFAPGALHVLTRESLELALPAGRTLLECASGSCEVEIGRRVGADYVVSGDLLRFGGELRLLLKLHHCASATFLGSEPVAGRDLAALERALAPAAGRLLERLRAHAGLTSAVPPPAADSSSASVPAAVLLPLSAAPARVAPVPLAADGDVLVRDELTWTTHDNGRDLDWYDAWRWCERCRAGGWSDWRLPEIEELETLVTPAGRAREFRLGTQRLWSVSMPRAGQAFLWDATRRVRGTAPFGMRRGARVICVRHSGE